MKAAPPAIGFKAENTPPPLRARGRPAGYPSKNITPLPTTGERPRQGAGSAGAKRICRRAHQRHEEPRPFRKSDVHKRLYLVPPFFGTGETIPASKGMPLSSISTLKFRACNSITTKILRRKSGTSTLAILGRAETWGVPLSSLESFPSPMPL